MDERKVCRICGKKFKPVRKGQVTCSKECAGMSKKGKWKFIPSDGSGKCFVCGSKTSDAFCCQNCYNAYQDGSYQRPLYDFGNLGTTGLIRKYHSEGMTPEQIAKMLARDINVVREVLENEEKAG